MLISLFDLNEIVEKGSASAEVSESCAGGCVDIAAPAAAKRDSHARFDIFATPQPRAKLSASIEYADIVGI